MKIPISVLTIVMVLILAACSTSAGETGTESALEATNTSPPSATATSAPTATIQPTKIILFAPPGSNEALVNNIEIEIAGLAQQDGYQFERVPEPIEKSISEEVKLVIVLPPDPGLMSLAQAYPENQFLGIGIPGLLPSNNLSIIETAGDRPDQQGFIAGYLSTVLTEEWRVGIISTGDTISGNAARNAFINGVVFYCGLCRSVYPPFISYPVYYDLPSGASFEESKSAADFLISQGVKTVYVNSGAGDQALFEYLAQAGINLIGGIDAPASVQSSWIASIQTDLTSTLQDAWPRIAAGESGIQMKAPLVINNRNETLFSPGRQRYVEKILEELLSGFIDTGIDPQSGEATY